MDKRFEKLMGMSYSCVLVEATGLILDMEVAERISDTYGLPIEPVGTEHPTLYQFLEKGLKTDDARKEFLAHLLVMHEHHEHNQTSQAPKKGKLVHHEYAVL